MYQNLIVLFLTCKSCKAKLRQYFVLWNFVLVNGFVHVYNLMANVVIWTPCYREESRLVKNSPFHQRPEQNQTNQTSHLVKLERSVSMKYHRCLLTNVQNTLTMHKAILHFNRSPRHLKVPWIIVLLMWQVYTIFSCLYNTIRYNVIFFLWTQAITL